MISRIIQITVNFIRLSLDVGDNIDLGLDYSLLGLIQ